MALIRVATGFSPTPPPGATASRLRSPDQAVVDAARDALQAMTPEALLQEARAVGLTVAPTEAGKLRVQGPQGTEEFARLVLVRKEELLSVLVPTITKNAPPQTNFEKELARLLARLDRLEALCPGQLTRPRRTLLAVFRQMFEDHAAQRSEALWDCEPWLIHVLRDRWGITEQ